MGEYIVHSNDFVTTDSFNITISEDILVASQVVRTPATDGDLDAITYSIIEGNEVLLNKGSLSNLLTLKVEQY